MIYYIAGPITNIDDYKRPFKAIEKHLKGLGEVVINPAVLPLGLRSHASYMNICLPMLRESDAIVLIPGWHISKGAKMEFIEAVRMGLTVHEADIDDFCRVIAINPVWEPEVF
ncbi:hypothetical protein fHeYen801_043 [Yersinia phage fHe-Yen8-01]|nr:hypothetical protein fHeYen801_043 [Yersinia phage fHe-Yen8-01]